MSAGAFTGNKEKHLHSKARCAKHDSVSRTLISIALVFAAWAFDERPPELKLKDLDGKKVPLSEYRGKPVVLNFLADWFGPWRQEMPMMVGANKTWAPKDVVFIAI